MSSEVNPPPSGDSPEFGRRYGDVPEMAETCAGCTICRDYCPAFVSLFELLDRRDIFRDGALPAAEMDRFLDRCFQCQRCVTACPLGFDYSGISFTRKTERALAPGAKPPSGWLTDPSRAGRFARFFAPVMNLLARMGWFRVLLEKWSGIDRRVKLPRFAARTLGSWFRSRAPDKRAALPPPPKGKVAYYAGCGGHYYSTEDSRAAVELLEKSGYEVTVMEPVNCGHAQFELGLAAGAVVELQRLLLAFDRYQQQGMTVVIGDPQCALMVNSHARHLLDPVKDQALLAAAGKPVELLPYLWTLRAAGELPQPVRELPEKIVFHPSCASRSLKSDSAGSNLLKAVPGLDAKRLDSDCCGSGAVWGMLKENHGDSLKSGRRLAGLIAASGATAVATDCARCRLQIEECAPGVKTVSPVEVFRRSVG